MTTVKMFTVLSPDGFRIDYDAFWKTRKEADAARREYPERFRVQGYYSTVRDGRCVQIPVEEIAGECEIETLEIEQVKVTFFISNQPESQGQVIAYFPEEKGPDGKSRRAMIDSKPCTVVVGWPAVMGMAYATEDQYQELLEGLEEIYEEVIVLSPPVSRRIDDQDPSTLNF